MRCSIGNHGRLSNQAVGVLFQEPKLIEIYGSAGIGYANRVGNRRGLIKPCQYRYGVTKLEVAGSILGPVEDIFRFRILFDFAGHCACHTINIVTHYCLA